MRAGAVAIDSTWLLDWRALGAPPRLRALRDGLVLAGLIFGVYLFAIEAPITKTVGFDAFSYWRIDMAHPYAVPIGGLGAFPYTPVAVRAFAFSALLSWQAFLWLWLAVLVATATWLGGRSALLVFAFPPVAVELYHGNLNLLIAAAIALGFRYPASWAFVLLTKLTPGVGLLWFAVRREWRSLAIALVVTGIVFAISVAVDGSLWLQFLTNRIESTATASVGGPSLPVPLAVRLVLAAILVAWGARTDRRWTVVVGATLATPVLWFESLSILTALVALNRPELRERPPLRRPA